MITKTTNIDILLSSPIYTPYEQNQILFFDIETTGFSAKTSYLYLIGCMYYEDNTWQTTQWLADDMNSEKLILEAFVQKLKSCKRLIHYNGSGFDIPFILKKCDKYEMDNPFSGIESFDIYKKITSFKKFLPVNNLKLKTMEAFLGINRQDIFSGEELIQIYANYLGRVQYEKLHSKVSSHAINSQPDRTHIESSRQKASLSCKELEHILLLHNYEDIAGLPALTRILSVTDIFEKKLDESSFLYGEVLYESMRTEETAPISCLSSHLLINLKLKKETPISLHLLLPLMVNTGSENDLPIEINLSLTISPKEMKISIPVFEGELKYFYENYREYYYLPKEDMAVHKSIGQYVDKEYKSKAKPFNCYTKKTGLFLPQPVPLIKPDFKFDYKNKISFFEYNSSLTLESQDLKNYISSLFETIVSKKETIVLDRMLES